MSYAEAHKLFDGRKHSGKMWRITKLVTHAGGKRKVTWDVVEVKTAAQILPKGARLQ